MRLLQQALHHHAQTGGARPALRDGKAVLTYAEANDAVNAMSAKLHEMGIAVLGLLADNGIPWVLADLAALCADIPFVPLPLFFSTQQILHALRDCGADGLLTDRPLHAATLLKQAGIEFLPVTELHGLYLFRLVGIAGRVDLPAGTARITYTSGTTGTPKGVCLSRTQMEAVAESLQAATEAGAEDCHLCLTPLSTLLENIGGVYVPLLAGACCSMPSLPRVGMNGAAGLDAARMVRALHEFGASSAIMAPQMLQALVVAGENGVPMPSRLRFVAVGGAPVSPQLLVRAHRLGIPVYEGYGLSECASVVALNTPGNCRVGSVGRPLPHISISFAADGEILVGGSAMLGYLGQGEAQQPWATGDLGYLDAEGFLHLTGRKKSIFITSFGRNVAPEWVERELELHPAIAQAAVFGEARPFAAAVIVPRPGADGSAIEAALAQSNHTLPDYARIGRWVPAREPFTPVNGQLTANGRLKREAIRFTYAAAIEVLYQEGIHAVL